METDIMNVAELNKLREAANSADTGNSNQPGPNPPEPDKQIRIDNKGGLGAATDGTVEDAFAKFNAEDKEGNRKKARRLKQRLKRANREPNETEARWLNLYEEANPRGRPSEDSPPPPPMTIDVLSGEKKENPPPPPPRDPWVMIGLDIDGLTMKVAEQWGQFTKELSADVRNLNGLALPDEAIDMFVVPMTKLAIDTYIVPLGKSVIVDPKKAAPAIAIAPALILYLQKKVLQWQKNKESGVTPNVEIPEPIVTEPPKEKREVPPMATENVGYSRVMR